MPYNEASFQPKMMLSSEFLRTKFSLLIDHLQKFHTAKISGYTVCDYKSLDRFKCSWRVAAVYLWNSLSPDLLLIGAVSGWSSVFKEASGN